MFLHFPNILFIHKIEYSLILIIYRKYEVLRFYVFQIIKYNLIITSASSYPLPVYHNSVFFLAYQNFDIKYLFSGIFKACLKWQEKWSKWAPNKMWAEKRFWSKIKKYIKQAGAELCQAHIELILASYSA